MTDAASHGDWTADLPAGVRTAGRDAMASDGAGSARPSGAAPALDGIDRPSVAPLSGVDASGRPWPLFAHGSEAEMARILDFYGVRWDYEPRTFPILWNLDGDVIESFSPDFYLPDLDLYLELTTLKQRLVRKKNRKLRRLRELYPDLRIKLFYARDFRAIMLKYGRLALADSMSGTLGQVASERAIEQQLAAAAAAAAAIDDVAALDTAALDLGAAEHLGDRIVPASPDGLAGRPVDPARAARNRSRSRRRRAAAAARSAATGTLAPTPGGHRPAIHDAEEGSAPR